MNTNSNRYTVIYTTLVCVLVAAILAVVSQVLKPRQEANEKAETIRQILSAAGFGDTKAISNAGVLEIYKDNISEVLLIDNFGKVVGSLDCLEAEVYSTSQLKEHNYHVKDGTALAIPVYRFKNKIDVLAVYGAGLWGPIWGYIAVRDSDIIEGAYFDHESETPGLGGKIKDDPAFRATFKGKKVSDGLDSGFVDAISGATMTSKGLEAAIQNWMEVYTRWLWPHTLDIGEF